MSAPLPSTIEALIKVLLELPGLGPKSASRLALFLARQPKTKIEKLSQTLLNVKKHLKICQRCFNISEEDLCAICRDKKRKQNVLCIAEEPLDIAAIEKTHAYSGLYFCLGGSLSPLDDINPPQLNFSALKKRLQKENFQEIIIATNPTMEGEATAMYLKKILPKNIKLTRLARGLPTGGDLQYADDLTLINALKGRKEY